MDSRFLGTATSSTRRPTFGEDDGLASIAGMEAGFTGQKAFFSTRRRNPTYRAFPRLASSSSSPRSCDETHHFLESCYRCKKPLGSNKDIFMYRGNTPFCSVECREEQIEIDEELEKNLSLSMKVSSRKEQQKSSTSSKGKSDIFHVRAGTVVAG